MLILVDGVVRGRTVRQVRVSDQAKLLQELERPVDRGDVHTGGRLRHMCVHLVRRGVPERVHSLQHELALRGEPQPTGAKLICQGHAGHGLNATDSDYAAGVADLRVVAVLGTGVVPADAPILRADDLGVLRGDGIFETMHIRAGAAWLLDEHLNRMAGSAERMQLALPPMEQIRELVGQALAGWPPEVEGALRVICTRGAENGDGRVTVFATASAIGDTFRQARHEGIRVLTAALGVPSALRPESPWLLGGAKTLSYAVNMASQRWALAEGADDVLWVSADGYALEAPTATLVWLRGETLYTVPAQQTGILAGTTARWLLDRAGSLGWSHREEMIRPDELAECDGAWFTSSVRGVAAIRFLDGKPLRTPMEVTSRIREFLGYP